MTEIVWEWMCSFPKNERRVPIDPVAMAVKRDITVKTLSELQQSAGMESVSGILGNPDGAAFCLDRRYAIVFSDSRYVTQRRRRFTQAEELSHIILGHLRVCDFDVFDRNYHPEEYDALEQEARKAAGIILCPPDFYFGVIARRHKTALQMKDTKTRCEKLNGLKKEISQKCNISETAAYMVLQDYGNEYDVRYAAYCRLRGKANNYTDRAKRAYRIYAPDGFEG